ncbi:hypothetical protein BDZ90DRAFT_263089 [Jaminaea rosea]|uniref:Uncharacterized protein n=1 Tax=Jaminaea rosea TaxID=1569628 RepID=A0A316UI25_9BASI|nr:hypothetical protein BDZ90DRAFT_263089 [Jaminaea rosea]PWN24538.1 hypothetical protein BDZ90DRAFT_263089 [Jaminaea rosea]
MTGRMDVDRSNTPTIFKASATHSDAMGQRDTISSTLSPSTTRQQSVASDARTVLGSESDATSVPASHARPSKAMKLDSKTPYVTTEIDPEAAQSGQRGTSTVQASSCSSSSPRPAPPPRARH